MNTKEHERSFNLHNGFCEMPNLWKGPFESLQQFDFTFTPINKPSILNVDPSNSRLGKLAERLFSIWINNQNDLALVFENLQIIENKQTLGELDFCVKNLKTNQYLHIELVTKFYLYNPAFSCNDINAWIGPNRNDSLFKKVTKLKNKQLPLLHHHTTSNYLKKYKLTSNTIQQFVCFKAWLFIPLDFNDKITSFNSKCIGGWYMDHKTFINFKKEDFQFNCPRKQDWLRKPESENTWYTFPETEQQILLFMENNQAIMVWLKDQQSYCRIIITPYSKF